MFTLVAWLRLGSESELSPEPSQCEIPQYIVSVVIECFIMYFGCDI